jgi:hypothetical protein
MLRFEPLYPSLSELLAQYITKLISFPRLFWHLLHISFPDPTKNKEKKMFCNTLNFFWWHDATVFFKFDIIYYIHSFYHIHRTPFAKVPLHLLSISSSLVSSVGKPPCGGEQRTEPGPALQQADALPTDLRRIH